MSIEIFVLSDRALGTIAEWQQAIDAEGFDLRLDTSRPFNALSGHLPAHRGESGEVLAPDKAEEVARDLQQALAGRDLSS